MYYKDKYKRKLPKALFGLDLKGYFAGEQGWLPDIGGTPTKEALWNTFNPYNYYRTSDQGPVGAFLTGNVKQYPIIEADDFETAFDKARNEHGPGTFFLWNGKRYKTDLKGETTHKPTQQILGRIEDAYQMEPEVYDRFINLWNELGQPNLNVGIDDSPGFLASYSWDDFGLYEGDHVNPLTGPGPGDLWLGEKSTPRTGKKLMKDVINELTHVKQQRKQGRLKYASNYMLDLLKSGFDQGALYDKHGTIEHDAHGHVKDEMEKYVYGNVDEHIHNPEKSQVAKFWKNAFNNLEQNENLKKFTD